MAKKDRVANPELRRHVSESRKLIAYGGLHHIKGNRAPYFSLTGAEYEKTRHGIGWQEASGGCIHDALLEQWPDLAPLAALHLSDIDGTPMHAAANGLYWLAGMFPDGLGESYHGGNADSYGRESAKPISSQGESLVRGVNKGKGSRYTAQECRDIAEKHFRCAIPQTLLDELATAGIFTGLREKRAAIVKAFCETQKARWKQEADSAIAQFGLVVYGDEWKESK